MGDVLQGAAVLCLCKLACSFFCLPSLSTSYSPVSLCCCCLLIFTDFLVTVFLGFLCIFESWLTELNVLGDVIALRFLLFLSHMYGAVLLLITPLIAVETLSRLLWAPYYVTPRKTAGLFRQSGKVSVEQEKESSNSDKDKRMFHIVGYFCCLSVWVIVALNVRWRWMLEEVWSTTCLHMTHSLIRCLPNLVSPFAIAVNPCWGMVFLCLLLLLLTTNTGLHRRQQASAQNETTHAAKHRVKNICDSCCEDLFPVVFATSKPGMSVSDLAQCIDPEKTESSCTVHRAHFWNSVQMSAHHHGDYVLIPSGCLSVERGGQEHERTKTDTTLTFFTVEHKDPQYRSQYRWGFPCPGVMVMIGLVGVLSIFVLPLNLSVNVLLIRTIETLLELCVKSLVLFASNTIEIPVLHNEMLV